MLADDGQYHKSSFSPHSFGCVEVATRDHGVAVRDSKDPDGPVLRFDLLEWVSFLQGARDGQFDIQH
jgi:hypothetical protein